MNAGIASRAGMNGEGLGFGPAEVRHCLARGDERPGWTCSISAFPRHCLARGDERPLAAAGGQQPALASRGNERGVRPEEVREMLRFGFVRGDERRKPCRIICTTTLWLRARGRTEEGDELFEEMFRFGFARVGERRGEDRPIKQDDALASRAWANGMHAEQSGQYLEVFASRAGTNATRTLSVNIPGWYLPRARGRTGFPFMPRYIIFDFAARVEMNGMYPPGRFFLMLWFRAGMNGSACCSIWRILAVLTSRAGMNAAARP